MEERDHHHHCVVIIQLSIMLVVCHVSHVCASTMLVVVVLKRPQNGFKWAGYV